ncbi:MAG: ABC transporter ATP-binding protein [Myxococcota bacterium]|nr:ABC transporter ATP-binding protein [Myxococcota bacterium]
MSFRIENLSFQYGSTKALQNVSFQFEPASRIALVGANGAGKSTLMALISGALRRREGTIEFNNYQQNTFSSNRTMVSHLPQDAYFPTGVTIYKALTHFSRLAGMSRRDAQENAERLLELVGLKDARNRNDRALSHGMRKRAALAQALVPNAPLLILDEPTAGLDPVHAHQVREIIRELPSSTTLLISSHNLGELEDLCDALIILDHGKTKFCGSMRDATQSRQHVRVRVSHIASGTSDRLRSLGLDVAQDDLELTLIPEPSKTTNEMKAQLRKALIIILESDMDIESIQQGSSLEDSLIETLKR